MRIGNTTTAASAKRRKTRPAFTHPAAERDHGSVRLRLRVRGAVKGVGFRPFAYGLATRLDLAGYVRNGPDGVVVEIEGRQAGEFIERLRGAPPRSGRR